jgi:RNA polymerase sigma-70 factor, ECF subfamily
MQAEGDAVPFLDSAATGVDFAVFFAEQQAPLFTALFFVTGNRADAAELAQDAFLKLWERWDEGQRFEDPTGYLFRVALNGWRMRLRSARHAMTHRIAPNADPDPFAEIDLQDEVRSLLLRLAPRQRAALLLTDQYGYTSAEAAQIMGIRPSTVRALATQGRAALRNTEEPHA